MNEVLSIILKDTCSLTQLKYRLRLLKSNLLDSFFGAKSQDATALIQANTSISPHDLTWLKSLPEDFYNSFTKDNVYEIFTNLEKEANSLPTLIMYLTFEPDEATLNQIGIFVRQASSLPALLLFMLRRFSSNCFSVLMIVK